MNRHGLSDFGVAAAACLIVQTALAQAPATQPAVPASQQPAATQPAQAVETPLAPEPQRSEPAQPVLDLEYLSFDLGFEGSYDRRSYSYRSGSSVRPRYRGVERSRAFEETIGMNAAGTLFDEKWLHFDLGTRWGLSQEWYSESRPGRDRSKNPHGDLLEYDLSFTLLPHGTVSATAYASRTDSRVPRAFLPSLDRTLERYGVDIYVSHHTLPMRFSFEHVFDELDSGMSRQLRDQEERGRDTFRYEATWQISDRNALRLEYQYDDRRERYSGTATRFDATRHYLVLNHSLRFGDEGRSSLETLARFQDERGALARDIAEFSTQLRLQHTDAFSTNYRVQFLRESFQELGTRTWRGDAGLTYQLSDSLIASVEGYGLRQSADRDVDFTELGGLANVSYNKENKLGRFSTNLSYHHSSTDTDNGRRNGVVISESVTLNDPLAAFLAHQNINPLSIVVTDARRTRLYLFGRDYILIPLGRNLGLRRVATGRIADRQTVMVSYTYRVFEDYSLSRDRVDLRVQQAFDFGLTPYYAGSIQDESIDQGRFLRFRDRDVSRHRFGATFRQKRWSTGIEYEYNDDSVDPYDALHLNADAVLWNDAKRSLDAKGTLSWFWFDGQRELRSRELRSRDTTLLDLGVSYRHLIARDLEANAGVNYRYEDDSFYGVTHGVDLSGAVIWNIGYFSLRFEAEYDALNLPNSNDDGFAVWLKLSREIPVITRKRS